MPSEVRQKKIMEKLNRAQKCSILGPQNLGSVGARAPGPPGSAPVIHVYLMYMQVDGVQNKQVFLLYEGVWTRIPEIRCVIGSGNRKM